VIHILAQFGVIITLSKGVKMKTNIKELGLADLDALYQFVGTRPFNMNAQAKKLINDRIIEIEEELFDRAFGMNPYKAPKESLPEVEKGTIVAKYEGVDPIEVMKLDMFKDLTGQITPPTHSIRTAIHEAPEQAEGTDEGAK
jgi:hypothetical protein